MVRLFWFWGREKERKTAGEDKHENPQAAKLMTGRGGTNPLANPPADLCHLARDTCWRIVQRMVRCFESTARRVRCGEVMDEVNMSSVL